MKKRRKNKMFKKIIALIFVVGIILFVYTMLNGKTPFFIGNLHKNQNPNDVSFDPDDEQKIPTEPKIKIYNMDSKTRMQLW